jgi:uncharacterized membrane protein HdeD (DUF308 family)
VRRPSRQRNWFWFVLLGIALIVLGFVALEDEQEPARV